MLQSIDHVIRFLKLDNELIAWSKNDETSYTQVWKIEENNKKMIANTSEEVLNVWKGIAQKRLYGIW